MQRKTVTKFQTPQNCHSKRWAQGHFRGKPYLTNVGQVNSTCPMLHRQVVVDVGQVAE